MSALGKKTRLNRIFSHPSGRIMSVAIDHLINYPIGLPEGLRDIQNTIDKIVEGRPSAITMNKGIAMHCMPKHAGKVPFIIQQVAVRADGSCFFANSTVEEVAEMGADAIAVAIIIKNATEAVQMKHLSQVVSQSEKYGLPVIAHIYPVGAEGENPSISNLAEDVFFATRIGIEMGVDVVKVPYTGDVSSYRDIISASPIPVVAAGGPKANTLEEAVAMMKEIAQTGASGATVGRNVWGFHDVPMAIRELQKAMFE